ncbi:glycosyltransferase [archaeon]|nr:glycosyltransferase [archaeon]MBT4416489.1 glycosyltransferase [archaeon]
MPVSIIIPAYNEEKYIEETLKALPKEHEIIVVCNGCTDKTEEIAKKYTDNVYVLKEKGVSMAKNFGASKAKNDKLIFLDADIIIGEDVVNAIEDSKYDLGTIKSKPDKKHLKAKIFMLLKNIWAKNYFGGGVIFCTKKIFNKVGGFDTKLQFKEDKKFLKEAKKITKYRFIPLSGTVNMRRHEKLGYFKPQITHILGLIHKKIKYKAVR